MNLTKAIKHVSDKFPFSDYMNGAEDSYENIAKTVQKHLKLGDHILDFGSGPCDKTAIIQSLGYKCSAYDDLSDDWHLLENNREKILKFSSDFGINFKLASDGYLPFPKESFNMVMLHDVLEHLHDSPRDLLNDLIELIDTDGYLFITVPNAVNIRKRIAVILGKTNLPPFESYFWYPGPWRGHIREYVKDDLEKLAEFLGLTTIELRGCHHMLRVLPKNIRQLYVLFTNVFPSWRDSWLLVAKKPSDWNAKRKISLSKYSNIMEVVSPYHSH